MRPRKEAPDIKFELFDLGSAVAIVIDGKPIAYYKLPFPMREDSIWYSLKTQGLENSIKNNFIVPYGTTDAA